MDERDFLVLARQLSTASTEAAWRTAVGRAYYAAFHAARRLLQSMGFVVPRADQAHRYLWLRLTASGDATVDTAGRDLNSLRQERNMADYDLHRTLRQAAVAALILSADQIIQTLDAAASEPLRPQVRDEMRRYERDTLHDVTWHP